MRQGMNEPRHPETVVRLWGVVTAPHHKPNPSESTVGEPRHAHGYPRPRTTRNSTHRQRVLIINKSRVRVELIFAD